MTDTLTDSPGREGRAARGRSRRPVLPARRASVGSLLIVGVPAALGAAAAGLVALTVPVLLVWAADPRSGAGSGSALRVAGAMWLWAHGVDLELPGGSLGLAPLGLPVLPLVLLARAAGVAAHRSRGVGVRDAAVLTAVLASAYGVVAAVVAGVCSRPLLSVSPVQSLVGAVLVGVLGAGTGVLRAKGLLPVLRARLPERVVRLAAGTAAATGVLLAAGALLAGGALLAHLGTAAALARVTGPGLVGGLALLLLGVALVPNAVVFGAAWLTGAGFAVGAGTSVGPFASSLGAVPSLALLAALPAGPVPAWASALAFVVPLAAGVVAGTLVVRRLPAPSWHRAAAEAALTGPASGAATGVLAVLAGGPLGIGRLDQVGPTPWRLALAVTVEVGVAAALAGALSRRRA